MASFLEDYGIDLDGVEANEGGFALPEEGWYDFTCAGMRLQTPDDGWHGIIIDYLLDETGESWGELFGLPEDPDNPTSKEVAALGRYKARLLSLGFEEADLNEVGPDDVEGITGRFELFKFTAKSKKVYMNARNVSVDEGEPEEEPEPEPVKKAPVKKIAPKATATRAPKKDVFNQ